jgi:hypothetical protein
LRSTPTTIFSTSKQNRLELNRTVGNLNSPVEFDWSTDGSRDYPVE